MKKVGKFLLVMGCIIGIAVYGIGLAMKKQVSGMYEQLDAAAVIALDHVADGTYEGTAETPLVKVTVGDVLLLRGEPQRIDTLKRSENSLGETTYVDINGCMEEDGITLAFDYEENCFREGVENDAYVLYSVGARKVKLAADFLYADHSVVAGGRNIFGIFSSGSCGIVQRSRVTPFIPALPRR